MSRGRHHAPLIPPPRLTLLRDDPRLKLAAGEQLHREGNFGAAFNLYLDLMFQHGPATNVGNRAGFLAALTLYQQRYYPAAINLMLEVLGTQTGSPRWQRAELHYNLAIFYHAAGNPEKAAEYYRNALAIDPGMAAAENNLANALRELGDIETAQLCYDRLLARNPTDPEARYNLAYITLMKGMFGKGFSLYEARWQCIGYIAEYRRPDITSQRTMVAPDTPPCRLFVHQEQGIGDTLQFLRYLPRLVEMGHDVTFEAPIELGGWLQRALKLDGVTVITRGTPIPHHDRHLPMMSLAFYCGTFCEEDIPPVLRPRVTEPSPLWSDPGDTRPVVGICWAGNPKHRNDHHRSTRLVDLAPLFARPNTRFVSLQVGERGVELLTALPTLELGEGSELIDCSAQLTEFERTAALVRACDAVVTVDTSIVHLAGTLGVRTLALTSWLSEWRWQFDRSDSPWYPSVTVVRQPTLGDWPATAQMARDLLEDL